MKLKKNPKSNLEKNLTLYFMIGLVAVLSMSYTAIEWKTYDNIITCPINPDFDTDMGEIPPITFQKLPPPPKPKVQAPPIIEIAPDDTDIIETVIESNEPDQNTEIISIDDIDVLDPDVSAEVSFIVIEEVPVFPGCEDATDKRACFQEMIQKHIRKNFKYPEPAQEMGLQGRVNAIFTIQKDGSIGDIKLRGPHEVLEGEAKRIISKLPKMIPGKQRGTPVKVPFAIPITFKLQ